MDPLWRSMEGSNFVHRKQLERVIQSKKLDEVYRWFDDHFVKSSDKDYLGRCPIVIFQGPTGCGKTSTLKWISNQLKIPIKEYSETTDTTALNYELGRMDRDEESTNLSHSIDKRRALKFEHFIIYSIRYNTLYPTPDLPEESSDFDDDSIDDGIESMPQHQPQPLKKGIIIHIDTPLMFVKSQRILIQTLQKLLRIIRKISPQLMRRVAIVFETLEGEGEIISLSTKVKQSLKIHVFKFNPIIRANMKKLVESLISDLNTVIQKETIEQLVNDCDGDIRACINTLQLICNKSPGLHVFKQIDHNSINGNEVTSCDYQQAIKKPKLMSDKKRQVELNPSLMRDNTRSLSFFHVLGKIFYQKRLYPEFNIKPKRCFSIDRPYPTENSTEDLANLLDVEPKNLIAWLHNHYYKFCHDSNVDKAALFLENLSVTDTTSINSTQSSQFYEMHNAIDHLQTHLSIESTVFSLYQDQSSNIASHKKKHSGTKLIKSSVESFRPSNGKEEVNGNCKDRSEFYSFSKPVSMSLNKLVEDHQWLLNHCRAKLIEITSESIDPLKILLDYAPYMNYMSSNWKKMSLLKRAQLPPNDISEEIYDDDNTMQLFETLERIKDPPDLDLETRHEKLMELIEIAELRDPYHQTNTY